MTTASATMKDQQFAPGAAYKSVSSSCRHHDVVSLAAVNVHVETASPTEPGVALVREQLDFSPFDVALEDVDGLRARHFQNVHRRQPGTLRAGDIVTDGDGNIRCRTAANRKRQLRSP